VLVFGIDKIQAGKVTTQLHKSPIVDAPSTSEEGRVGWSELFGMKFQNLVHSH
jgi:hypothetical protein